METAAARTADGNGAPERRVAIEPTVDASQNIAGTRSEYVDDLRAVLDKIEAFLPKAVLILRKRIADLEACLAQQGENPYINNGNIAATYEVVEAMRLAIQRVVGVNLDSARG